jgi:hypothetical protein
MTSMKLLSAGAFAVAMLATPAMAQEATQEPGVMGYNYPNSAYLRGGYGQSFKPRPADYYNGYAQRAPSLRTAPEGYGYYGYGAPAPAYVPAAYGAYGYYADPY